MRISVWESRELQALLLALRGFDRELNKQIRQRTKAIVQAAWQQAVRENASTALEQRVLGSTARAAVSNQNVTLKSAAIGRSLSGGLKHSESWHAVEFGGDQASTTTYTTTSRRGNRYSVTRHTKRQLRPRRKAGYVVFQAAAEIIPRIASLWTQTAVRTFYEALEKGK